MIKFSKDKVLLLHRLIAEETGGSIGVRDEALLDSALENAFAGFGGQEFYPTKEEKGARLGYSCGRRSPHHRPSPSRSTGTAKASVSLRSNPP